MKNTVLPLPALKKYSKFFLFLSLLILPLHLAGQNKNSVKGDYQALQDLYHSTDGSNWYNNKGWKNMTPQTMGKAVGVEVNKDGRVISIDLQRGLKKVDGARLGGNDLRGQLPKSIGNLSKVEYFNVKHNQLTGPIPKSIGNMESLVELILAGQMCSIRKKRGSWNDARYRQSGTDDCPSHWGGKEHQETNTFSGEIPATIGKLKNLELFEARRQFFTGTLPETIGNMASLKYLYLDNSLGANSLGGPIPSSIGELDNLIHLYLGNRDGEGSGFTSFPSQITQLSNIAQVHLAHNSISGDFPKFPNARDLRAVDFRYNNIMGKFPIEYFNGDNALLTYFRVEGNTIVGQIPSGYQKPTYPTQRDSYPPSIWKLYDMGFTGPYPEWMRNMGSVIQLDISNNEFTGPFPKKLANLPKMKRFEISHNKFSGPLPEVTWKSENLNKVSFADNNFTGTIPDSWQSLDSDNNLHVFNIRNNELHGKIPMWAGNISQLDRMYIDGNHFTFCDILPTYDAIKANVSTPVLYGEGRYVVAPQKPFGKKKEKTVDKGDDLTLDLSKFDYGGNRYQWLKDGSKISGANSHTLVIKNVNVDDAGEYHLAVSNPALPELGTHNSQPIMVQMVNNGGNQSRPDSLSAPVLISPTDDDAKVPTTLSFKWRSVDADQYILHISRENKKGHHEEFFYSNKEDITITDTTITLSTKSVPDRIHSWRVRGVKDGVPGKWSSIRQFVTKRNADDSSDSATTVSYQKGWNLVSIPRNEEDKSFDDIFKDIAANSIYSFDGTYTPDSKLIPGKGYWIKLLSDQQAAFEGASLKSLELSVESGWNLIGTLMNPVDVKKEISDANNIIAKVCFPAGESISKLNCKSVTTLKPGKAYFLKATDSGTISMD
ncbi:MAG TPA: hypothetical protein VK102_02945 [Sphingobacterium sp.]|nr:hypothetical protein [Sphingobacterium sp.]